MDNRDRVLDWGPNHDPKSLSFAIRPLLTVPPVRRNKLWTPGPVLDQGREGACVGFGWASEALSTPVAVDLKRMKYVVPQDPNKFASGIYHDAKYIDEWAGEDYDGTSVLAGAKIMKKYGLVKEYRWAFGINDVIDAILAKGPVVLGIYWYDSMYEAPNGVVDVSGDIVGGHCILAVGFRLAKDSKLGVDSVILKNSWGYDWGNFGLAEISVDQLAALLKNDGEACIPSIRSYGR